MAHPPQIPLTPTTDERNFPRHQYNAPPGRSGHGYPKMLTRPFRKDEKDEWRDKHRRIDVTTRQEFYEERIPKVGDAVPVLATEDLVDAGLAPTINEPVVVNNADEEERALAILGGSQWPVQFETPVPSFTVPIANGRPSEGALEKLRRENAELEAEIERNQKLKERLSGKQEARPGRRAKASVPTVARGKGKRKSALQSLQEFSAGEDEE